MAMSTGDLHCCEIDEEQYYFRTPTARDLPRMRRVLTREGIRQPKPAEIQTAALAGVAELARMAGEPAEGERQAAVMEEWYRLREPIREDDIDEPDLEARAVEFARLLEEREAARLLILADVTAIQAVLSRYWLPYAELTADATYCDEVLTIDSVRLLLVRIGEQKLALDREGMIEEAAYQSLPLAARPALAAFATRLLVPSEDQVKN